MNEAKAVGRHYGMDWLRIAAFLLLILYHVGLAFSPWEYEWKSDATADWVALPLLAMNAWRLSLLFAISGYASAALYAKFAHRPGRFAGERMKRLFVPLLFGMLVIMPPQPWVSLVTQYGYTHDFGYFLTHDYYTLQELPGGTKVPTWMQLWFVAYLLLYTLALSLALAVLPERVRAAGRAGAERLLSGWLLIPLGILYVWAARTLPGAWSDTHDVVGDRAAHVAYAGAFLFGWLLRGSEPIRAAIARQWTLALLVGLAGAAAVIGIEARWPGDTRAPDWAYTLFAWGRAAQCWGIIVALFGFADTHWNRDHPWRATLAEAVFPFYIIHQTVILLAGYWVSPLGWSMGAQWAFVTTMTVAGCVLFYLVGSRIGWLRPLIGLRARGQGKVRPVVAGAVA